MATKPTGQRGQHHKRKTLEPIYLSFKVVGYKFTPTGRMLYTARERAKPDNIQLSEEKLLKKLGLKPNTISEWRRKFDDPLRGEYPPEFKDTEVDYFTQWWDQAIETYSAPVTDLLLAMGLDRAGQDYRYWKSLMESYGLVKQNETQVNVLAIPVNLDRVEHLKAEDYEELRRKLLDSHRGVEAGGALVNAGELALAGKAPDGPERQDSRTEKMQSGSVALDDTLGNDGGHARSSEAGEVVSEQDPPEDSDRVLDEVPAIAGAEVPSD